MALRARAARVATALALLASLAGAGVLARPAEAASGTDPILTVAGNGVYGFDGDGASASRARLNFPTGVTLDGSGSMYIADSRNDRVRKVDPSGVITTLAGNGKVIYVAGIRRGGYSGDGGPATEAQLDRPDDVAVDAPGNVYILDSGNQRIRKVDASGTITTVAGNGGITDTGDGGPAVLAGLGGPAGVAVDGQGNLFIATSTGNRVRKVDTSGTITTVAGNGSEGYEGDGGPATEAKLARPNDVAVDGSGNFYVADKGNNRIRKVDASGTITTVAGHGRLVAGGPVGDGGPATEAKLASPFGVAVDGMRNLFIADTDNFRVRKVDASGVITTVAGTGDPASSGDGGPANQAGTAPWSVAVDATGSLYIPEGGSHKVRRVGSERLKLTTANSPEHPAEGSPFVYTHTITNPGTTTATGVKLVNTLPPEVSYRWAASGQGTCSRVGATVTCALANLAPRGSARVQIAANALKLGPVMNTATVASNEADPYPPNNTSTARTLVSARGCGRVITANTALANDIGPCAGNGLIVGADNITVDLGGKRIFGFPGPSGVDANGLVGNTAGIRLPMRNKVTVKNGVISDFDAGVVLMGGGANTVTAVTARDNIGPDDSFQAFLGDGMVLFNSRNNIITKNTFIHNGIFDGIAVLGPGSDGNSIQANTVQDTVGTPDGGPTGQGIMVNAVLDLSDQGKVVSANRIVGNVVRRNGSAGISNVNHTDGAIVANLVEGNGTTNSVGNGIGIQLGPGSRETSATRMKVQGNEVHGNGVDGIRVALRAVGNTIVDNDAANNNTNPAVNRYEVFAPGFDLRDFNKDCATNAWSGNSWGSGGFNPPCTAVSGSGPPLSSGAASAAAASPEISPFPVRRPPPLAEYAQQ